MADSVSGSFTRRNGTRRGTDDFMKSLFKDGRDRVSGMASKTNFEGGVPELEIKQSGDAEVVLPYGFGMGGSLPAAFLATTDTPLYGSGFGEKGGMRRTFIPYVPSKVGLSMAKQVAVIMKIMRQCDVKEIAAGTDVFDNYFVSKEELEKHDWEDLWPKFGVKEVTRNLMSDGSNLMIAAGLAKLEVPPEGTPYVIGVHHVSALMSGVLTAINLNVSRAVTLAIMGPVELTSSMATEFNEFTKKSSVVYIRAEAYTNQVLDVIIYPRTMHTANDVHPTLDHLLKKNPKACVVGTYIDVSVAKGLQEKYGIPDITFGQPQYAGRLGRKTTISDAAKKRRTFFDPHVNYYETLPESHVFEDYSYTELVASGRLPKKHRAGVNKSHELSLAVLYRLAVVKTVPFRFQKIEKFKIEDVFRESAVESTIYDFQAKNFDSPQTLVHSERYLLGVATMFKKKDDGRPAVLALSADRAFLKVLGQDDKSGMYRTSFLPKSGFQNISENLCLEVQGEIIEGIFHPVQVNVAYYKGKEMEMAFHSRNRFTCPEWKSVYKDDIPQITLFNNQSEGYVLTSALKVSVTHKTEEGSIAGVSRKIKNVESVDVVHTPTSEIHEIEIETGVKMRKRPDKDKPNTVNQVARLVNRMSLIDLIGALWLTVVDPGVLEVVGATIDDLVQKKVNPWTRDREKQMETFDLVKLVKSRMRVKGYVNVCIPETT